MSQKQGRRKIFDPEYFTVYEYARRLGVKYSKALKLVKKLVDSGGAEPVEDRYDKRKKGYRLL